MPNFFDKFDPPVSPRVEKLNAEASTATTGANVAAQTALPAAQADVQGQQLTNVKTGQDIARTKALNAPIDLNAENQKRLARQARTGLPVLSADFDPYRDYLNSRQDYNDKRTAGILAANPYINKNETDLSKIDKLGTAADGVLQAYSQGTHTGGVFSGIGPINTLRSLVDPAAGAFGIAAAAAKADLRVPGDIISNFDAQQYGRGAPGLDKPEIFNKTWAMTAKATQQRANDWRSFRDSFITENGTTNGLQDLWNKYNTENPIFAKNSKGAGVIDPVTKLPRLNPNRVSWREFYKNRAQTRLKGGKLPEEIPPDTSAWKIEELPEGKR